MTYADTYEKLAEAEAGREKETPMGAARAAFLQAGKPSLSIRQRAVLPRDDLDERLDAAITAYMETLEAGDGKRWVTVPVPPQ